MTVILALLLIFILLEECLVTCEVYKVIAIEITSIANSIFFCLVAVVLTKVCDCNYNYLRYVVTVNCEKKCVKYFPPLFTSNSNCFINKYDISKSFKNKNLILENFYTSYQLQPSNLNNNTSYSK